jgi:glycine/sarcosine/betaine reductase complex component A
MLDLAGKLVLCLGERDGIPASAIEACVLSAGAQVVYADTQCFV